MVCYIKNPDHRAKSNKYAKCSLEKKIAKLDWITSEDAVFDFNIDTVKPRSSGFQETKKFYQLSAEFLCSQHKK